MPKSPLPDGIHQIGIVGVDAGLMWIGDPCYILHKNLDEKPKSIGRTWSEFCELLEHPQFNKFDFDRGHEGLGICVSDFGGDGSYPVSIEVKDGMVKSMRVNFSD